MHTLGRHRGSRYEKRKSAYTRRTPKAKPQRAKSVHTSLPRVLYKKYAYKAAADCEKVHTLGGHPKNDFTLQKVHTLGRPRFALFCMHTRPPPLCCRLRKSAYTSRTPSGSSAGKKYAYKAVPGFPPPPPERCRQKVYTQASPQAGRRRHHTTAA